MNHRGLVGLPRNWRVITVASLTTLGLAYGAGQSALGDWWSLPRAKPEATKAAAAKPVSTENGFSSTIQRLTTDARLYADKGEFEKAVQLAERAAKISEASSQLLGPASEYTPEKTARFANEMRARRDAVAKRATPAPAPATPTVAAAARANPTATRTQEPTAPRTQEIASSSPPPQPLERLVVERALAERTVTAQPAELVTEPPGDNLTWDEELPPTPTPEAEPASKPIKFRRSVLVRASQPTHEESDESQLATDETAAPSMADSALEDLLDAEFASDLSVASEPTAPSTAITQVPTSLNEPVPSPSEESLPSLNGDIHLDGHIQPVAAEAPTDETAALPAVSKRQPSWEDEAFADELLLTTKSARPTTKTAAPPFPEDAFPVQRVVQLRRRLETAASLNPGVAYTMSASPVTEPASDVGPASSADSGFELPFPSSDSSSGELNEEIIDWSSLPDANDSPRSQPPITAETTQTERPSLRLREHRVLPDHVRAALIKAAALPPAPTARRHIVGYSEPMLWQSVDELDPVLSASALANGASLPPDMRDIPPSATSRGETKRAGQRVIPGVTVEQTGFRSSEAPLDSIPLPEPRGPALTTQNRPSDATPSLSDSIGEPRSRTTPSASSNTESGRSAKRPASAHSSRPSSKSKSSHEVSHQSFALIEPLATALQLPIATTASLLGGAGLALLGLGLLLIRAAIRWRHA